MSTSQDGRLKFPGRLEPRINQPALTPLLYIIMYMPGSTSYQHINKPKQAPHSGSAMLALRAQDRVYIHLPVSRVPLVWEASTCLCQ